jgi:hypothetical protein
MMRCSFLHLAVGLQVFPQVKPPGDAVKTGLLLTPRLRAHKQARARKSPWPLPWPVEREVQRGFAPRQDGEAPQHLTRQGLPGATPRRADRPQSPWPDRPAWQNRWHLAAEAGGTGGKVVPVLAGALGVCRAMTIRPDAEERFGKVC